MTDNFIDKFRYIKHSEFYIAYMGKFNNSIGPPASMLSLYNLLSKKYKVFATSNLLLANKNNPNSRFKKMKSANRDNAFFNAVKRGKNALLLISYILKLKIVKFINPRVKIIATQPFALPSIVDKNFFYIRRVNSPLRVKLYDKGIYALFERLFSANFNGNLIYLVPQTCERQSYSVISNSFSEKDFVVRRAQSDKCKFFFVGSWIERKGVSYVLELLDVKSTITKPDLHVMGSLGEDDGLNRRLCDSKSVKYHGQVSKPFNKFSLGDVFISFSEVEGLQRSLIEAMLMGCLVFCFRRPDTVIFEGLPGFFFIDKKEFHISVKKVMNKHNMLSKLEREKLGLSNREYAKQNFCEESVLEEWGRLFNNMGDS